ncbi:MAG: hypothetical protein LRY73_03905 [Bacillus sp. (in: Bacteria)]|nr:hypothetical protein [Bacillus sp. (in: firmicutes)]
MKKLTSKYGLTLVLLIVLAVAVNAYLYFTMVSDAKDELAFVKEELMQEDQLLAILQNRVEEQQEMEEVYLRKNFRNEFLPSLS